MAADQVSTPAGWAVIQNRWLIGAGTTAERAKEHAARSFYGSQIPGPVVAPDEQDQSPDHSECFVLLPASIGVMQLAGSDHILDEPLIVASGVAKLESEHEQQLELF